MVGPIIYNFSTCFYFCFRFEEFTSVGTDLNFIFFVFNCADLTDEFPPIHVIFSAQFPVLSCSAFYWFTGKKIPVSKSLCTVCFGSTNRSIALLRGLEMRCDRDGPGVTCQRKFCLPFVTSG